MSITAIHRAGHRSLLLDLSGPGTALALSSMLEAEPLSGQQEVLPGAGSVLLSFDTAASARRAVPVLRTLDPGELPPGTGKLVEIPVHYNGADLDEVAALTGLSREAVISIHCAHPWLAVFGGFAPGFAYLAATGGELFVPRRDTPRTRVPAGSVALAGGYSAIYPSPSPGGWQLVGHTNARLWSLERAEPALIQAGNRVRFLPAREHLPPLQTPESHPEGPTEPGADALEVFASGLQSLLQDKGRRDMAGIGVGTSGSADAASAAQANRLVGNDSGDAVIENLFGGLSLRAHGDQVLAVTGARTGLLVTSPGETGLVSTPAQDAPFLLPDGHLLTLGPAREGLRCYVAVRCGFNEPAVLGSRSTDTLSGLGPQPLVPGRLLPLGAAAGSRIVGHPEPGTVPEAGFAEPVFLRVIPGPRDDWFGSAGLERLCGQEWLVDAASNRVGLRLALPVGSLPLERIRAGEPDSEGMVTGALQVPPSGLPVLFLADHPVTGGYPVIGVVAERDVWTAAQLRPGTRIRFSLADEDAPVE
ncbi:urea amidolyase family protein [Paeniglutamicibacter cryotolerans]|uniref:KipI family sensor histidine kinase inhibitor n=1 Tax=Paeniglutamicibacter cryotolerans TaxID=670079 RepID=A0A839QN39_9MICC|nr:urea amidolyase family protein [Paeniglutamicibacter cryotolerans]MBB2994632.1 KipI family sensor histidine kinase inhibitor [Paeniglutamicibacter cryotolerans]